ncbi:MAG: PqqD family protein, partial [Eubacterium sp.]|nr:PqqD family protein [Eubacterium sp.]
MGSFIWPLIDGKTSIYNIGEAVKEHFGEEEEPLYPRLVQ